MLRYQIEALRFWKSRCEQDLRLLENLWSPDHVSDTFELWCSFWQQALLDYSTEAGRLADIGSILASITAKAFMMKESCSRRTWPRERSCSLPKAAGFILRFRLLKQSLGARLDNIAITT